MTKIAFVTGGTGFVGSHLIRRLLLEGWYVKALVRPGSNTSKLKNPNVEIIYGDLSELFLPKEKLKDVKVVFHIASVIGSYNTPFSTYWKVNVEGTENLISFLEGIDLDSFVYCSSVAVYGRLANIPTDENSPCRPNNIYGKSKYEAEKIVLSALKKGFPVSIIRPSWIYGPGDRRTLKLFKAIKEKKFFIIGNGETLIHPVYVEDVVKGLINCARKKEAIGNIYIIAGYKPLELKELVKIIAELLGVRIPRIRVPASLGYFMALGMELFFSIIRRDPPLSRRRLGFFLSHQSFDIRKAISEIGYEPDFDIYSGMRTTIKWYLENGYL